MSRRTPSTYNKQVTNEAASGNPDFQRYTRGISNNLDYLYSNKTMMSQWNTQMWSMSSSVDQLGALDLDPLLNVKPAQSVTNATSNASEGYRTWHTVARVQTPKHIINEPRNLCISTCVANAGGITEKASLHIYDVTHGAPSLIGSCNDLTSNGTSAVAPDFYTIQLPDDTKIIDVVLGPKTSNHLDAKVTLNSISMFYSCSTYDGQTKYQTRQATDSFCTLDYKYFDTADRPDSSHLYKTLISNNAYIATERSNMIYNRSFFHPWNSDNLSFVLARHSFQCEKHVKTVDYYFYASIKGTYHTVAAPGTEVDLEGKIELVQYADDYTTETSIETISITNDGWHLYGPFKLDVSDMYTKDIVVELRGWVTNLGISPTVTGPGVMIAGIYAWECPLYDDKGIVYEDNTLSSMPPGSLSHTSSYIGNSSELIQGFYPILQDKDVVNSNSPVGKRQLIFDQPYVHARRRRMLINDWIHRQVPVQNETPFGTTNYNPLTDLGYLSSFNGVRSESNLGVNVETDDAPVYSSSPTYGHGLNSTEGAIVGLQVFSGSHSDNDAIDVYIRFSGWYYKEDGNTLDAQQTKFRFKIENVAGTEDNTDPTVPVIFGSVIDSTDVAVVEGQDKFPTSKFTTDNINYFATNHWDGTSSQKLTLQDILYSSGTINFVEDPLREFTIDKTPTEIASILQTNQFIAGPYRLAVNSSGLNIIKVHCYLEGQAQQVENSGAVVCVHGILIGEVGKKRFT